MKENVIELLKLIEEGNVGCADEHKGRKGLLHTTVLFPSPYHILYSQISLLCMGWEDNWESLDDKNDFSIEEPAKYHLLSV